MYRNDTSTDSIEHTTTGRSRARWAARLHRTARAAVAAAAAGTVAGALALPPAAAHAASMTSAPAPKYAFQTLDNQADPTFNQLLGINSHGVIAGYFGSGGDAAHPNKGYRLDPPYGQASYVNENFPGSAQTQVTGIDNKGNTTGFWVNNAGTNRGFVEWGGVFESFTDPHAPMAKGAVTQLLGINNNGVAVGFYNDAAGNSHAFQVNQATGVFTAIRIPGEVSAQATGINNLGDIVGFGTDAAGVTTGWLLHAGHLSAYQFPGGSGTTALGINDHDEIAGFYSDGAGVQHGFTLKAPLGPVSHWQKIDDPNGVGSTVVNGLNNAGDLAGFYTDNAGHTHGMLATPATTMVRHLTLSPMPAGTVSFGRDGSGHLTVTPDMSGLTPGSSHAVQLVQPGSPAPVASFTTLTASGVGQANATLDSSYTGSIPAGSRLVIQNGTPSGSVAAEPIAKTASLSNPGTSPVKLTAVEVSRLGHSYGTPLGQATITYKPGAQTLTVVMNASGLTPGKHAAHIHIGSCASQGAVQYMLMDFVANPHGQIVNQTRTVTGVTAPIPPSGWYLNVHQGNSNNILQNGSPTINFRPLLCSNIP